MPKEDFNALLNILKNRDKTAQLTNSGSVVSERDCSELQTLEPLHLQFDSDFIFKIPPFFYTQKITKNQVGDALSKFKCRYLFKENRFSTSERPQSFNSEIQS